MIRTTPKDPEMRTRGKRRHLEEPSTFIGTSDFGNIAGVAIKRRGRPPSDTSKQLISLRLDQDVIAKFRETGEGWQTRINEVLRQSIAADIALGRMK